MTNKKMNPLMTKIEKPKDENVKVGMDFSYFQKNKVVLPVHNDEPGLTTDDVKKPARKRRSSDINTNNDKQLDDTNEPYSKKYEETTNMLKGAINQLDMGLNDIQRDIHQVRSAKTMSRKYDHLSAMQGNIGQLIGTKITALREINNTITKCNELEMKRMKEIKLAEGQNDDKTIMDMYNAFISTPTSAGMQLGPSLQDISTNSPIIQNNMIGDMSTGYQNYLNNLSPTQILMMHEDDPDVQQVIVYDESTGAKRFEIMNLRTNEVIQGADKHGAMFLEDTDLDLNNNIARNIKLGESYPIVRVGNSIINTY